MTHLRLAGGRPQPEYRFPCSPLYNLREMTTKPSVTIPGTVEKIIPPLHPSMPEKAQIAVEGADHLYKEIRIENSLTDEKGRQVKLKLGAEVDVKVEAAAEGTVPKLPNDSQGPSTGKA